MPHLRGRGRGDLFVHVLVATPTDLTPEQDELLRQFAASAGRGRLAPGRRGRRGRLLAPALRLWLSAGAAYAAITVRAAAAAQVFVDDPAHPVLADEDVHHLGRVLRLRPGEEVIAADGRGRWARTTWRGEAALEPLRDGAGVGGDGAVQFEARAEPALTVAFAPVKGERPEWVVQKLTELGIDRIVPLLSERSVVRWSGARGQGDGRAAAPGGARGGGPVPAGLAARGRRHGALRRPADARRSPGRSCWPS